MQEEFNRDRASTERYRRADYFLTAGQIRRIQRLSKEQKLPSSAIVRQLLDFALRQENVPLSK